MKPLPRRFDSPFYTLFVISAVFFSIELLLMLVFSVFSFRGRIMEALVDAVAVTAFITPVMYLYFTKPLLRLLDEKNQIARELAISERRFRDVAHSTGDWVWEVDNSVRYVYASANVTSFLGYPIEEVLGKTPFDFMDKEEASRVHAIFRELIEGRMPIIDLENWNITKDGRRVCLLTNGVPIIGPDGDLLGYRGVDKDITRKKEMEEALFIARKQEATAILAGGIAHDFRNLLTVVQGNVDVVLMLDKVDTDARHMLEAAKISLFSAKELINQFLTFSAGGLQPHQPVPFDLIMENALSMKSEKSGVSLHLHWADNLWKINGDVHHTALIFRHLLENAQESMPDGGVVDVSAMNLDLAENTVMEGYAIRSGRYVKVSVSDQGKGIPRDELTRVFDAYHSTKERGARRGMGLGLTLTYSIVKDHAGYITIMSEEGRGTTVDVYLPAA